MASEEKVAPGRKESIGEGGREVECSKRSWERGAVVQVDDRTWDGLYAVYNHLNAKTRQQLGLMIRVPVFIKDPLVATENPLLGVQNITVRLEKNLRNGPTSSRVVVVDYNADTQSISEPVIWNEYAGWFQDPLTKQWLPEAPDIPEKFDDDAEPAEVEKFKEAFQRFIKNAVNDPAYHQLNVWAVVQRVLEFYEDASSLGRPVPWGFDGNRLMVVPHAGFGENAFYDHQSKSLQFYYFGDRNKPGYSCLACDIIAHETGHAILDGIRPWYNSLSSIQTSAVHEFIADLTALLIVLFNNDIRHFVSGTSATLKGPNILTDMAKEFSKAVTGRNFLRSAFNDETMGKVKDSLVPHAMSLVLTGAMWEIYLMIVEKHMKKNLEGRVVKLPQAMWWAAERLRRVALQPLDLCPPCDIQFIDYARAVIRNDIITNPEDVQGYRPEMLRIFHERELCPCKFNETKIVGNDCLFFDAMEKEQVDLVHHDIERISRSRTASYYFLSDNRRRLRIPQHQDVQIADLYETNKMGAAASRLERETVLEYVWQEVVELTPTSKRDFGKWNGDTCELLCGGTLVFDERGNLHSWFHKPGTEHITPEEVGVLEKKARKSKIDIGMLKDLEEGKRRREELLTYISRLIKEGLVGDEQESRFSDVYKPVTASGKGGIVRFEIMPHLRSSGFERGKCQ